METGQKVKKKGVQSFVIDGQENDESLQNAFRKYKKQREREMKNNIRTKKKKPEYVLRALADPDMMMSLRLKLIDQAKKYFGVPYARKYWSEQDEEYHSKIFLDCCGLVRRVMRDLQDSFGFRLGPWNQAYQHDTLPIVIDNEENMKPGDLVFISAIYNNTKMKKQRHNLTHVEIWLGDGVKTIGSRWHKGHVQIFDDYKFNATSYHSPKYIFKSIDTWLMGICRSHCRQHTWKSRNEKYEPSKKSIFKVNSGKKVKAKSKKKKPLIDEQREHEHENENCIEISNNSASSDSISNNSSNSDLTENLKPIVSSSKLSVESDLDTLSLQEEKKDGIFVVLPSTSEDKDECNNYDDRQVKGLTDSDDDEHKVCASDEEEVEEDLSSSDIENDNDNDEILIPVKKLSTDNRVEASSENDYQDSYALSCDTNLRVAGKPLKHSTHFLLNRPKTTPPETLYYNNSSRTGGALADRYEKNNKCKNNNYNNKNFLIVTPFRKAPIASAELTDCRRASESNLLRLKQMERHVKSLKKGKTIVREEIKSETEKNFFVKSSPLGNPKL